MVTDVRSVFMLSFDLLL